MWTHSAIIGLALLCGGLTAGSALATPMDRDARAAEVRYSDLDLSHPEAARVLYQRIKRAAREVCGQPDARDLSRYRSYQKCYEGAVEHAVEKVDSKTLTALHRNKTQHMASG
jgi:UrcA family protein